MAFRSKSTIHDDLNLSSDSELDDFCGHNLLDYEEAELLQDEDQLDMPSGSTGKCNGESMKTEKVKLPLSAGTQQPQSGVSSGLAKASGSAMASFEEGEISESDVTEMGVDHASKEGVQLEPHDSNLSKPAQSPKAHTSGRRHFDSPDRPLTETQKMLHVNPRDNLSLDDIINSTDFGVGQDKGRTSGRDRLGNHSTSRIHYPQRRPQQHRDPNSLRTQSQQNEKLKKGLEHIVQQQPEADVGQTAQELQNRQELTNHGFPEWTQTPWLFLRALINRGYSIYWALSKLKNADENDPTQYARMYRCIVKFNDIIGVCEAHLHYQAKEGAASNFLENLSLRNPHVGNLGVKLDETIQIDPNALTSLMKRLEIKYGNGIRYATKMTERRLNRHTLYTCNLNILGQEFEGHSYDTSKKALLAATKKAYEKLLEENYPLERFYIGEKECTTSESLYEGVESQMVHCYDFRNITLNSFNPHGRNANGQGHGGWRYGRPITVSYDAPRNIDIEEDDYEDDLME